jgi:hypothetical protein
MRKEDVATAATRPASLPSGNSDRAPVQLVCLALGLSLVVLLGRIVSIW